MLTSLSRTLRSIVDTALRRGRLAPAQLPAATSGCGASLRLVQGGAAPSRNPDIAITVELPGASAFVAGSGARLYSLDAFRHARGNAPRPRPRAA